MTEDIVYVVVRPGESPFDIAGVYTDIEVAKKVKLVHGFLSFIVTMEVGHIPPGYLSSMKELGLLS